MERNYQGNQVMALDTFDSLDGFYLYCKFRETGYEDIEITIGKKCRNRLKRLKMDELITITTATIC